MRYSKVIAGVSVAATVVLAASIQPSELTNSAAGYVADSHGRAYMLQDTENGSLRAITRLIDSDFTQMETFSVEKNHACKFYR